VPGQGELAGVVYRNIRALLAVRQRLEREKTREERVADAVTRFTGSLTFVWIHGALFGGWILWNALPGTRKFDPYPFIMLAMAASVEAIFLSTFVLISQNRQALMAEKRAELDLQINLLAEHEVTRLIGLCERMAAKLGVGGDRDLDELKHDVKPDEVLGSIEAASREQS
jgi:uncharacterized membrane protein